MSIQVHINWQGADHLVGILVAAERSSTVSFEYAPDWLDRSGAFSIDPTSLPLQRGVQYRKALGGAVQDCGPDRWGRVLIERAVRKKVLAQKPYRDIDYVLALDDVARIGALRFKAEPNGPFMAPSIGKLPPLIRINALLRATDAIHTDTETAQDLSFLLGAGSPLGGARPKAAVTLPDGSLAIAKFPKPDDTRDIPAGEILALTVAQDAGISVPKHQRVPVQRKSVAVVTRFDRIGAARVPFLSAMSLLGLPQGESGSYTMMADAIRQYGDKVQDDLSELWRRMIFSLLASNYDDHLRNHGFLMVNPGRWSLSPAYDLNPVPEIDRGRMSKTCITELQEEPTIEVAMAAAERFGLTASAAKKILHQVSKAVANWRQVGRRLLLSSSVLNSYETAFENPLMDEARRLVGD